MVPLNGTFQKMNRIVRDMSKKLGKPVELVTVGGETEVDKTINDAIADPFMHIDPKLHGSCNRISGRASCQREAEQGTITSARNVGGEIIVESSTMAAAEPSKLLEKARTMAC